MTQQYTVIWRPISEEEFRLDHVEAEPDRRKVLEAAAAICIEEGELEDEFTVDDLLSDYECIVILEGHVVDAPGIGN